MSDSMNVGLYASDGDDADDDISDDDFSDSMSFADPVLPRTMRTFDDGYDDFQFADENFNCSATRVLH